MTAALSLFGDSFSQKKYYHSLRGLFQADIEFRKSGIYKAQRCSLENYDFLGWGRNARNNQALLF